MSGIIIFQERLQNQRLNRNFSFIVKFLEQTKMDL
nr:MAG TPA: hypothetical protein [Bacteriophage sp.]